MIEPMSDRLFVKPIADQVGRAVVVDVGALVGWSRGAHTPLDDGGQPLGAPRVGDTVVYQNAEARLSAQFAPDMGLVEGEEIHVLREVDVLARVRPE